MIEKNKWLFDEILGLKQKLRFKDRIEYRVNGKLHNTVGPAVIGLSDDKNKKTGSVQYFIKGEEMTFDEWSILTRPVKIKKIIRKIKNEKGK